MSVQCRPQHPTSIISYCFATFMPHVQKTHWHLSKWQTNNCRSISVPLRISSSRFLLNTTPGTFSFPRCIAFKVPSPKRSSKNTTGSYAFTFLTGTCSAPTNLKSPRALSCTAGCFFPGTAAQWALSTQGILQLPPMCHRTQLLPALQIHLQHPLMPQLGHVHYTCLLQLTNLLLFTAVESLKPHSPNSPNIAQRMPLNQTLDAPNLSCPRTWNYEIINLIAFTMCLLLLWVPGVNTRFSSKHISRSKMKWKYCCNAMRWAEILLDYAHSTHLDISIKYFTRSLIRLIMEQALNCPQPNSQACGPSAHPIGDRNPSEEHAAAAAVFISHHLFQSSRQHIQEQRQELAHNHPMPIRRVASASLISTSSIATS